MAASPEAFSQLARLIGLEPRRPATPATLETALDARFDQLVEGLIGELMASDDVIDRDSALSYLESRLAFFDDLISEALRARLRAAVAPRIEAW